MQPRRASRELALLALFQWDQSGESLLGTQDRMALDSVSLNRLLLAGVRVLVDLAKEKLETGADQIAAASRAILDMEFNHPDNLNRPLEAEVRAVRLPNTQETLQVLEQCLQGIEHVWEALRIPELNLLTQQEDVREYAIRLILATIKNQEAIDGIINEFSAEWRVDRLARMDRTLLRLAIAELRYVRAADASVVINEAVELSKQYSTEESYRFINGVLGQVVANA
jgi:N utilization substance protein B